MFVGVSAAIVAGNEVALDCCIGQARQADCRKQEFDRKRNHSFGKFGRLGGLEKKREMCIFEKEARIGGYLCPNFLGLAIYMEGNDHIG